MTIRAASLPPVVFDGVIDVSHHNGAIDWPAVAAAGIALAFIKATQGTRFVDPAFEQNRAAATSAGVLAVPYHFIDEDDPEDEAAHFLSVACLGAGQPAMIDWENSAPVCDVVALGQAIADCTGREPVAYYGFAQLPQAHPVLSHWPLMLPAYPGGNAGGHYHSLVSRPPRLPPGRPMVWDNGTRPYDFHQYTPSGRVPGIGTCVDRSVWIGTSAELRAWFAAGGAEGAGG